MLDTEITKLDIFDVLKNINNKNFDYYEKLSDEHKKMFTPFVVFQWLQSSSNKDQILMLNHINKRFFELSEHHDLIYRLFCASSKNKFEKYSWMAKKSAVDNSIKIIAQFFNVSKKVAKTYKELYNNSDVLEMAQALGFQDKELAKLKMV